MNKHVGRDLKTKVSVRLLPPVVIALSWVLSGCVVTDSELKRSGKNREGKQVVADQLSDAQSRDGKYISWREHIIDDSQLGKTKIEGSDGLAMADLDGDGYLDIVSVHEADTSYDGIPKGKIRIAYGTGEPNQWELATLVEGPEAGGAEDLAIGDINGDGHPDIIAACELAHLIYFQNPGRGIRTSSWKKIIPDITTGRGSFIRVFLADLTGNGRLEVISPNKGAQNPDINSGDLKAISWFELNGDPLLNASWQEHELTRIRWPINSQPVDLDGDGDFDVVGGSVAEARIMWFENNGNKIHTSFTERPINVVGTAVPSERRPEWAAGNDGALVPGFNMSFADLNNDARLDIVLAEFFDTLVWLEQPEEITGSWILHSIGVFWPDMLAGLTLADINGDGRLDVITGGYSRGPRDKDGDVTLNDPLGRLAWFEQPENVNEAWKRHDISRRKRGMFDQFIARDLDNDGDLDFLSTRGNSAPYDGVFWLEQIRTKKPTKVFERARQQDSMETALPEKTSISK